MWTGIGFEQHSSKLKLGDNWVLFDQMEGGMETLFGWKKTREAENAGW